MLTLKLLGSSASAHADAEGALRLGVGKPLAVLAYLATAPNYTASRGRIVDLLWADVDQDAAKHALRQTLWYLRRRLGESVLATRDDSLILDPFHKSDRSEFLDAINGGRLVAAVDYYAGEFFPGFAAPGGAEFERWADVERAYLRGLFVRAAEDVARELMHGGHARPAIAVARRARDADPGSEPAWRVLFEALLTASDRIGAATEADAFERRVTADELEPEPATRAILRTIRSSHHAPLQSVEPRATLFAELVGREQEFSTVLTCWERVRTGMAMHVHLIGAAGLGKTRLLTDIEARLRATRARIVRLRAAPGERAISYALAAEIAISLARLRGAAGVSSGAASTLVTLNPAVSAFLNASAESAGADDVLRRRTLALHELLQSVSSETPIALLIDDLHWADDASRRVLDGLASRLQNTSVLLITASRPPSQFARDDSAVKVVALLPLDAPQVGALIASIAKLPVEDWADRISIELNSAAGGSPLLTLELLQFALDQQCLRIVNDTWQCSDPAALIAVLRPGHAVERRVAELDVAMRDVLLVLSLAGIPIMPAILASALDGTHADLRSTLLRLEQIGLVVKDGGSWLPLHDEIASASMSAADENAQQRAQRGLAVAFSASPNGELAGTRRALSHALASGDDVLQATIAREYVSACRERGEVRTGAALIAEACGASASAPVVRGLVATLPLRDRIPWRRPARAVAFTAVLVAAGVGVLSNFRSTAAEASNSLIVSVQSPTDSSLSVVDIDDQSSELTESIVVDEQHAAPKTFQNALTLVQVSERPNRKGWTGWRTYPGTTATSAAGNLDITTIDADGSEHRIASHREDDVAPSWSPDGKWIVFLTRRWQADFGLDVAMVEVATDSTIAITRTALDERWPIISVEGTRVAFLRQDANVGRFSVCVVRFDGSEELCRPISGDFEDSRLFFLDGNSVILSVGALTGKHSSLLRMDVQSGDTALIDSGAPQYTVSPDGAFAVIQTSDIATGLSRWEVLSLRGPTYRKTLRSNKGRIVGAVWRATKTPSRFVASIRVQHPEAMLPIGISTQLRYKAADQTGKEIAAPYVQWTLVEKGLASIDSRGLVIPLAGDSVHVVASIAAVRPDTAVLHFTKPAIDVVLDEQWTDSIANRWQLFGFPMVRVARRPDGGAVLHLAGDRENSSGLFVVKPVVMQNGGGVQVDWSLPVTARKWQTFVAQLIALPRDSTIQAWTDRRGDIPPEWNTYAGERNCAFGIPSTETAIEGRHFATVSAGNEVDQVEVSAEMTNGSWHTVLIQIFVDGRCGIAIDGRPRWVSQSSMRLDLPMHALMGGRSFQTNVLAGRTRMWTGVNARVDWNVLTKTNGAMTQSRSAEINSRSNRPSGTKAWSPAKERDAAR